ncbi:MAG: hypothetical protein COB17_11055, partial [Sulfurimonas sp.]
TITNSGDTNITAFSLSDSTNFEINASGYIKTKTTIDYETTSSYSLEVNATNSAGDSVNVDVNISILNINERPSIDLTFLDINISEDSRTSNYDININDEDGDSLTLSIDSNDTSILAITKNYSNPLNQASYNKQTLDFNLTTLTDAFGEVRITMTLDDGDLNSTTYFDVNVTAQAIVHNNTTYYPVKSPYTGKIWLDRNLGSSQVCTAYNDSACYGDYYQWGRDYDGHQESNSTTITALATDVNNTGHSSFIIEGSDWANIDLNGSLRSASWSKTDGTSVCPTAYRVPTLTELKNETTSQGVKNNTDAYNNFLKLPSAGYRNFSGESMTNQGYYGFIWSSSVSGSGFKSRRLGFHSGNAYTYSINRANGVSVRCLKD